MCQIWRHHTGFRPEPDFVGQAGQDTHCCTTTRGNSHIDIDRMVPLYRCSPGIDVEALHCRDREVGCRFGPGHLIGSHHDFKLVEKPSDLERTGSPAGKVSGDHCRNNPGGSKILEESLYSGKHPDQRSQIR